MKTEPNDSAFATMSFDSEGRINEHSEGLTKREYFAAMAMQGILSNEWFYSSQRLQGSIDAASEFAVKSADALISELNKP